MTRTLIVSLIAIIFLGGVIFSLPIGVIGATGAYNWNTGLYWCTSEHSCRHELGHAMDKKMGHPSQSIEFKNAVTNYLKNNPVHLITNPTTFAGLVHLAPGMDIPVPPQFQPYPVYSELYAEIYAWADGCVCNMPIDFKKFYGATP